jgi:hypothetical protein
MKKFLFFFFAVCFFLAVIGGFGYTLMLKKYVIAIAILVLGGLAVPTLMKYYKELAKPESPEVDEFTASHTSHRAKK